MLGDGCCLFFSLYRNCRHKERPDSTCHLVGPRPRRRIPPKQVMLGSNDVITEGVREDLEDFLEAHQHLSERDSLAHEIRG